MQGIAPTIAETTVTLGMTGEFQTTTEQIDAKLAGATMTSQETMIDETTTDGEIEDETKTKQKIPTHVGIFFS